MSDLLALFGTEAPPEPSRALSAGPLAARLEAGNLRHIAFAGTEVLRAIGFVVRDRDWGTYAPEIENLEVVETPEAFTVGYRTTCRGPALLRYAVRIEGTAEGRLRFEAEAVPEADFETNRAGFVILHPAAAAGAPATVEHCDGSREATAFPELIDPWQPFLSIRAITHRAGAFEVACRLEGEDFEMEDQRNWSDASFKTYGRPLALPWPFTLPGGVPFRQSVTLAVDPAPGAPAVRAASPALPRIEAGAATGARFPEIGLVVAAPEVDDALRHAARLAEIAPQRLLLAYDPARGDGPEAMAAFARLAAAAPDAALDLECVVMAEGDLEAELLGVAEAASAAGLRLASVSVSPSVDRQSTPPGSAWPACPPLEEIYAAARAAFPGLPLGGGMFSYFTELNRKRPPVRLIDFVTWGTCPIVHAADDLSVMETLEALPHITRSARAIIGDRPCRLGPSTIAMRQNPYGSRTIPNPRAERVPMTDDDPRQRGRFAAAWTAGYAAAIAPAGIAHWVPAAFTGPRGLLDAEGRLLPVGEVVRDLARLAGAEVLEAGPQVPRILAVLAVRHDGGARTVVANLTPAPLPVEGGTLAPFEVRG